MNGVVGVLRGAPGKVCARAFVYIYMHIDSSRLGRARTTTTSTIPVLNVIDFILLCVRARVSFGSAIQINRAAPIMALWL